jgi:hypothetical protein
VGSRVIVKQFINVALVASQNRCVGYRLDEFINLEAKRASSQFSLTVTAAAGDGRGGSSSSSRCWQHSAASAAATTAAALHKYTVSYRQDCTHVADN